MWIALLLIGGVKLCLVATTTYHSTDFEVHRNWLALTSCTPLWAAPPLAQANCSSGAMNPSLRIVEWYSEHNSIWSLDYPPLFAYFEWMLSQVIVVPWNSFVVWSRRQRYFPRYGSFHFHLIDEGMLQLHNLNYASRDTLFFQRLTVVIFSDVPLLFTVALLADRCIQQIEASASRTNQSPTKACWLCCALATLCMANPALILIDNVHFQYNGLMFAVVAAMAVLARRGGIASVAASFTVLVLFKHMFLYYAMGCGAWLVTHLHAQYRRCGAAAASRLLLRVAFGVAVVVVAALGPMVVSYARLDVEGEEGCTCSAVPSGVVDEAVLRSSLSREVCPWTVAESADSSNGWRSYAAITGPIFRRALSPRIIAAALQPMLRRLFPFGRGLCHAYWAPNAYPLYTVLDKVLCKRVFHFSPSRCDATSVNTRGLVTLDVVNTTDVPTINGRDLSTLPTHAVLPSIRPWMTHVLVVSCFALLSAARLVSFRGRRGSAFSIESHSASTLLMWCVLSATSFFFFSWHVHEKAFLSVVLPLQLLPIAYCDELSRLPSSAVTTLDIAAVQCWGALGQPRLTKVISCSTFAALLALLICSPLIFTPRESMLKYTLYLSYFMLIVFVHRVFVGVAPLTRIRVALLCAVGLCCAAVDLSATSTFFPLMCLSISGSVAVLQLIVEMALM